MSEHLSQPAASVISPPIAVVAGGCVPERQRAVDVPVPSPQRSESRDADPPGEASPRWPRVFPGL